MKLALFALAIGAFGIGTTEFVIVGLLPEVAADRPPTSGCRLSYSGGETRSRRRPVFRLSILGQGSA